jgi:hypothetical protein
MTQSLAYKIIRQRKMRGEKYRAALDQKKTRHNLELAKGAASDFNNESTSDKAIWKGTKHKDLDKTYGSSFGCPYTAVTKLANTGNTLRILRTGEFARNARLQKVWTMF